VNGETGSFVAPGVVDLPSRAAGRTGHLGRELLDMRTVLCTPAARRAALLLTVMVGTAGVAGLTASTADAAASSKAKAGHHRHAKTSGAVLGPAVKYVRESDGTVRQVR
jgi:hypothetical protein